MTLLISLDQLDKLEEILLEGGRIPFTGNRLVNEHDAIDTIDDLRESLPGELTKASQIINQGQSYIKEAQHQAEEITLLSMA